MSARNSRCLTRSRFMVFTNCQIGALVTFYLDEALTTHALKQSRRCTFHQGTGAKRARERSGAELPAPQPTTGAARRSLGQFD